jgi:hypothetical protein
VLAALVTAGLLTACSGAPPSPDGWQPVPGASPDTQWSSGQGADRQTYEYRKTPFTGTLQELTSQQAVAFVAAEKGARFQGSDIFAPCPGQAAIANFVTRDGRLAIEGLAVINGNAVVVTYLRPNGGSMGVAVAKAFEAALCVTR